MYYYKTLLQYDGTNYAGFQWQNNIPTIQNEINNTLSKVLSGKFSTLAASRTDSGVHAFEQVLKITAENKINLEDFLLKINQKLPSDIKFHKISESVWNFKPAALACSKEYRYVFTNTKIPQRENQRYVSNISNNLDLNKINECIKSLIGEHDFCNFCSTGSNVKSTFRTILECEMRSINPHDFFSSSELFKVNNELAQCFELRIVASGFLKQMVRHIVSALWMVGSKKITPDEFLQFLNCPKTARVPWKVAPPNGLFLYKISY